MATAVAACGSSAPLSLPSNAPVDASRLDVPKMSDPVSGLPVTANMPNGQASYRGQIRQVQTLADAGTATVNGVPGAISDYAFSTTADLDATADFSRQSLTATARNFVGSGTRLFTPASGPPVTQTMSILKAGTLTGTGPISGNRFDLSVQGALGVTSGHFFDGSPIAAEAPSDAQLQIVGQFYGADAGQVYGQTSSIPFDGALDTIEVVANRQ